MNVPIYITDSIKNASVSELDLEKGAMNAILRTQQDKSLFHIFTIGDALTYMEKLKKTAGVGKTKINRIKNAIINYTLEHLPSDEERLNWFLDLVEMNTVDDLRPIAEGFKK